MSLRCTLVRNLRPLCALILSLGLCPWLTVPASAQTVQPVLSLDAGGGLTAEFSDYSLTAYSPVSGGFRGTFCFTLKNTSQQDPNRLPSYLVALGLRDEALGRPDFQLVSATLDTFPVILDFANADGLQISYSALLVAENYDNYGGPVPPSPVSVPTGGIPSGSDASFCMVLFAADPFTLEELITKFSVFFSDVYKACFATEDSGLARPSYGNLYLESLNNGQLAFRVQAAPGNPSAITGIGFAFPGNQDFSLLSINPRSQPGKQRFSFEDRPERLWLPPGTVDELFDFGLITGPDIRKDKRQFGVPGGQTSSTFRIQGNFGGMDAFDILNSAAVGYEGVWISEPNFCSDLIPTAPPIRGAVATTPR